MPMKPKAAPLSALGQSTSCNLPTMNAHTSTHKHTYNLFLFFQCPLLDVETFTAQ